MLVHMLLLSPVESILLTHVQFQRIRSTQLNHKQVSKYMWHIKTLFSSIRTQLYSTVYRHHAFYKENFKVTFQKLIQVHGIMQDFLTTSAIKLGIY